MITPLYLGKTVAYPGFHFCEDINLTQIENLSKLLFCPFEVQYMAILGYKSLYTPPLVPQNMFSFVHLVYGTQLRIYCMPMKCKP